MAQTNGAQRTPAGRVGRRTGADRTKVLWSDDVADATVRVLSRRAVMNFAYPSPTLPPRPRHEAPREVYVSVAVLGDVSAQLDAHFADAARLVQWRYWPVGRRPGPLCGWTSGLAGGHYWSFAAVPVGRGARSLEPAHMLIAVDSWAAHDLRKDARVRAWQVREHARAGVARPWRRR